METPMQKASADAQRKVLLRRIEQMKDNPAVQRVAAKYGGWQAPQPEERFDRTQPSAEFKVGVGAPAVQDMPVQPVGPSDRQRSNADRILAERDAAYAQQSALERAMNAKYADGGELSRVPAKGAGVATAGGATTLEAIKAREKSAARLKTLEDQFRAKSAIPEENRSDAEKKALLGLEANIAHEKSILAETPAASGAAPVAPINRTMSGMGEGGTPLLTNRSEDDLYTAMEQKFGPEAQTRRVAPTPAAKAPVVTDTVDYGPALEPIHYGSGGAQDRPMASPTTKVVNGATYQKVAGGWQLVGK